MKDKEKDSSVLPMHLPQGMAWNPLLGYPRNAPCPCESGKKHKDCHEKGIRRMVTIEQAEIAKRLMDAHLRPARVGVNTDERKDAQENKTEMQ